MAKDLLNDTEGEIDFNKRIDEKQSTRMLDAKSDSVKLTEKEKIDNIRNRSFNTYANTRIKPKFSGNINAAKLKEGLGDYYKPYKKNLDNTLQQLEATKRKIEKEKLSREQGFGSQLGGFLNQAIIGEIVGGTIEGAGYLLDVQSMFDGTLGEGNALSDVGSAIKDWTREVTPIHMSAEDEGTFNPGSSAWWFSNGVSVASVASIMIPVAGWTRGVGLIGKGLGTIAKAGKAAKALKAGTGALKGFNKIDDAARALPEYKNKFNKIFNSVASKRALTAVHQGLVSRHIESNMEASGVYKETYERILAATGDEILAKQSASDAASFTYNANAAMLLQDIPQYFLLGRGMKATRSFSGFQQMKAAGETTKRALAKSSGRLILDGASEFGEEAYQYIVGEEAAHFADVNAGLAKDSNFAARLANYTKDGEFWTSGFFGAIGAGAMQTVFKPGFEKISGASDSRIDEIKNRGSELEFHSKQLRAAAESGIPKVYQQALLDASTSMALTAAKEGNMDHYIDELTNLKSADEKTKAAMGLDETFIENIDNLIADAKQIKKVWNSNSNKFDPSMLPHVVQSKFIISKLDTERKELIQKIDSDRNDIYRYNELSADGKKTFDAKLETTAARNAIEHAKKIKEKEELTDEQKESFDEFIEQQESIISNNEKVLEQLESDDNIELAPKDKEILKLLNNKGIVGDAVSDIEKLAWQDKLIDTHIKRLNAVTNREIVGEARKNKANLEKGKKDFRRVQQLYSDIYKGAKEEIIGKRKTIGVDKDGKPIKEESEDFAFREESEKGTTDFELTKRYEKELTPEEKQNIINEAKEILARTTDKTDKENIAKMIEDMEKIVKDEVSRFQKQEKAKAKALQELIDKKLAKIKRLNAVEKGKITKQIAEEIALAYDQYAMIDHAYDDTPLGELFFKDTDTLQVFHNGEKGILYKTDDTNEVVFQSSSSGKEFIINGSIEDTVSDLNLGISKDSYFPVDITVAGDTMSIWIGDSELSHIGTMPQESLNYDEAGNLESVTLVNGKGEEVEITGEILMYEVADMLLVYQLAIEQFLGKDQTFTIGGKEYQIGFNASDTMQSKVFEVLRDEKGEILMTEEVLPGKRNIYNKDGSLNKKGRILNEIQNEFREQLIKDIVGYTEGDTQFAPRIQKERETVREYVERGKGPLTKRKGETNEEYALRTGDTSKIKVANRESEILKLQKKLEDPNITEEERTATLEKISQERQQQKEDEQRRAKLESESRYAIKGTNKWILKEQNEEVTDTEDVPTEPPGRPTDEKGPDETKPKGESTKNPKTEEEITDQFIDPDISEADLLVKAISKVFEEFEPKGSKLTEELKNAQSIEDLQGLLNKKTDELSSTSNVTEVTVDSEGHPVIPHFGDIVGEGEVIPVSADDISLNSEEKAQLESDIERINNFISKVKTEFATIKDEAIKAQLEASTETEVAAEPTQQTTSLKTEIEVKKKQLGINENVLKIDSAGTTASLSTKVRIQTPDGGILIIKPGTEGDLNFERFAPRGMYVKRNDPDPYDVVTLQDNFDKINEKENLIPQKLVDILIKESEFKGKKQTSENPQYTDIQKKIFAVSEKANITSTPDQGPTKEYKEEILDPLSEFTDLFLKEIYEGEIAKHKNYIADSKKKAKKDKRYEEQISTREEYIAVYENEIAALEQTSEVELEVEDTGSIVTRAQNDKSEVKGSVGNIMYGNSSKSKTKESEDSINISQDTNTIAISDGMGGESFGVIGSGKLSEAITRRAIKTGKIEEFTFQDLLETAKSDFDKVFTKAYINILEGIEKGLSYKENLEALNDYIESKRKDLIANNVKEISITQMQKMLRKQLGEIYTNKFDEYLGATTIISTKKGENTYSISKIGDTVYAVVDENNNVIESHGFSETNITNGVLFTIKDKSPKTIIQKSDNFEITLKKGQRLILATDFIETKEALNDFLNSYGESDFTLKDFIDKHKFDDATYAVIEYSPSKKQPEPLADTSKSRSTQQDTGRIDGSIETKTYAFKTKEKPIDNKKTERLLIFDSQGNPIPKEDLGVSINTDILSNPNLMKKGAKIFLQPLRNNYFRDNFENNDQIADTNYFESIPIIVYINDENGNKVPIAILKATGATEKELQLRKAVYDNWVNQEQSGYMIGELQLTSNDTVVNMTAGQNLRRVTNDENESVVKPLAERWTAGYQFDDSGDIVLRKNDQLEFKFGIVNKPIEGNSSLQFPGEDGSNLGDEANLLKPKKSQAGQIYGAVLNGNGNYIFPKLSTSNIDNKAADIILDILKRGEKVTIEDIQKIQKIIFVEYENDTIINKVETITGNSDDTVDLITINWNRTSGKPYVTFMNNGKAYSIDVKDLNEKEPKSIRRKKVEKTIKTKKPIKLVVDDSIDPKDVLTELKKAPIKIIENIIKNKKYNVQAVNLNSPEEYTSPITGKIYKTYNDYLIGRPDINETPNTEVDQGRSILQTDIQPSDGGNYFYDMQIQVRIGEQMFEEKDSEVAKKVTTPTDKATDEASDKADGIDWGGLGFEDTSGTIETMPSMSPLGRFNMFLNKFNIQLSGFSSMKPGKVSQITQQFKNEAKVFGLEGRVSKNGSLYLYDPSIKKPLVKANSPSNNPNFKLNLNRLTPVKSKYSYESTRVSSGRTINQLGISPLDWATLTVKEKENIIKCK